MTITFNVAPELEQRLQKEAAERGQDTQSFLEQVLREALDRVLPSSPCPPSRVAGLNAGPLWISDDFDAPLPDSFWLGSETDVTGKPDNP